MKRLLFVSGVARSGTGALVNVLNVHPKILIGQERYFRKFRNGQMSGDLFDKDRFLDIRRPEDTHDRGGLNLKNKPPADRFDQAVYIGDKYPGMFRHLDEILPMFPDAAHLYIVRNPLSVVESYHKRYQNPKDPWKQTWRDGMTAWNESVAKVASLSADQLDRFHLVEYEEIFKGTSMLNRIFKRLDLPPVPSGRLAPFLSKFQSLKERPVPRRDDFRLYVARHADWDSYKVLRNHMTNARQERLCL